MGWSDRNQGLAVSPALISVNEDEIEPHRPPLNFLDFSRKISQIAAPAATPPWFLNLRLESSPEPPGGFLSRVRRFLRLDP